MAATFQKPIISHVTIPFDTLKKCYTYKKGKVFITGRHVEISGKPFIKRLPRKQKKRMSNNVYRSLITN